MPLSVMMMMLMMMMTTTTVVCAVRRTLKSGLTPEELAVVLAAK